MANAARGTPEPEGVLHNKQVTLQTNYPEDGVQHVTRRRTTVDSMLCLHWILTVLFWHFLLHHRHAQADEEALWGPTPPVENQLENKPWWKPSFKLPSLPSLPFRIPFYGSDDAVTTAATGLGIQIDYFQDHSGSGEENIPEEPYPPTTFTPGLLTSVTKIQTKSLPTRTSDSPHGSRVQIDNNSLVSHSYSPTNNLSTDSLPTTNAPENNVTHPNPPWGTATSMGAHHLLKDKSINRESFIERHFSTIAPETTVPTALTWAQTTTTTTTPGVVETTRNNTIALDPRTQPSTLKIGFIKNSQYPTVRLASDSGKDSTIKADLSLLEHRTEVVEKQPRIVSTAPGIDYRVVLESITSTTQTQRVNFPISGALPGKEDDEEGLDQTTTGDYSHVLDKLLTSTLPHRTDLPSETPDWLSSLEDSSITFLPDCNKERSGICNNSDTWDPLGFRPTLNTTATNQSFLNPFLISATPMLVPLYTDWNSAMADWGMAWEAHVYGAGFVFAMLTLASALNLLCLPLRCPSGCGYFALVSLFLLAAGCTRSFSLLYDAYGHQDRLPSAEASLMLYEAPFPCLTAAFGLVFLLLSMRSRMQLSYSAFQRPCFLACLVTLHFAATFGPVTLLKFYQQKPPLCLFLSLISRGTFVALATFLSTAYFVFYIYVRADSKHIYHLNNTSPTPAERYNRCPFAESRDWNRAAVTVCLSALFSLACAGLQLYAMLNAMGVAGGEEVFHPWPWWAFHFSCRLCELGVCLSLALVVAQPVYCSDHLPAAGTCWTELLTSKSPILPGSYQWTLSQQEKLAIVDTVGLRETENLPLYTLMDERLGNSLNGIDLLYHSNRALAYRDLDLELDLQGLEKSDCAGFREQSGGSSFNSDSTTDLRPPSPINLRRSIDEALFSDSLFPMSLFSPVRQFRGNELSMTNHWTLPSNGFCDPVTVDPGLYRTSSCVEMTSNQQPHCIKSKGVESGLPSPSTESSSNSSSPERWMNSSSSSSLYRTSIGGSSMVLCPSLERHGQQHLPEGGPGNTGRQREYHTLGTASQESLDLDMSSEADRSIQEEFISACRQIDSLSICSETIDL
uniref:Proline-rich transmembrane protein 3/4 domain-containing protein n=1 Tax=Gouania willdenowi TaxID=441366 RepID=A0A8C5H1L8_GOUWI